MSSKANLRKLNLDKFTKEFLRAFRKFFDAKFTGIYEAKRYHWVGPTMKKRVRSFFIEEIGLPEGFYEEHEAIYCHLIFNTKKGQQLCSDDQNQRWKPFLVIMDDVFGNKTSVPKRRAFLANPAIRTLWHATHEGQKCQFHGSAAMMEKLKRLTTSKERNAFRKSFGKVIVPEDPLPI